MIKTTLIGGVFFLIPLAFLMLLLGEAFKFSLKVAEAVEQVIPLDSVAGIALVNVLAILFIVVVCFIAGLLAKLPFIRRNVDQLDGFLVEIVPGYAVAKSTVSGVAGQDAEGEPLKTVIATFDDHQQVAFEVERIGDKVILFLPGAPSAWNGTSVVVDADRVQPLNLPVHQVTKLLRVLGRGSHLALAAQSRTSVQTPGAAE